ncbi:PaaX family transcriptional regulator [Nocardioides marmorisolisilvae]|uniref:PaaX family transcriptional regulator n=1 Tax=Nocardioides marmorisolisilvae TaxID=1542737 RepID=A0A3N0DY34_9ACTN|nr:PaaX family transcriptional regulator C-terminal domain-containing protein [Nocardioides marmorisolisilvae]RNL80515.1 PaaX family transcriptional regulator [Nocardioides marmorisolisilvae]
MHARSALFDLYGDHLRSRGGRAPVAVLIRLLEPLGVSAPAVRTALSRMVAQEWLTADDAGGYALTEHARTWLDEAGVRIYRTDEADWDGHWHLRVLSPITDRARRERVRSRLRFLGMAPVSDSTWVSPRASAEVDRLLEEEGVDTIAFTSQDAEPTDALLGAFDLTALGSAYDAWLGEAAALVAPTVGRGTGDDVSAFVVRSELLHSWRKFLFSDPGLPRELLPGDWPGHRAAAFFDEHATRLLPAASRFIDHHLQGATR